MGILTEKCTEGKEMNEHGFSKNRGVFFFLQKPDPISLSSYTNKLEVE